MNLNYIVNTNYTKNYKTKELKEICNKKLYEIIKLLEFNNY